jgi:small subunit ribosomal protein S4
MGDPKKHRKRFSKPAILWQKERILQEKELIKNFGLKNKKEIWKFNSMLKRYTTGAKQLISAAGKQAEIEKTQLLQKLSKYGLIEENSRIEDVLNLNIENLLDRRLETRLVKLGLARSMKQSRQYIVHQHVKVAEKTITSPSFMVTLTDEKKISFNSSSSLADPQHPERAIEEQKPEVKAPEQKDGKTQ